MGNAKAMQAVKAAKPWCVLRSQCCPVQHGLLLRASLRAESLKHELTVMDLTMPDLGNASQISRA